MGRINNVLIYKQLHLSNELLIIENFNLQMSISLKNDNI